MVQCVKALVAKADDFVSILRTHVVEQESYKFS